MMVDLFSRLWRRGISRPNASTVVYECRRCGTSLDGEVERCPHCGLTSVARYEIR